VSRSSASREGLAIAGLIYLCREFGGAKQAFICIPGTKIGTKSLPAACRFEDAVVIGKLFKRWLRKVTNSGCFWRLCHR
jgi:hypothetical protein